MTRRTLADLRLPNLLFICLTLSLAGIHLYLGLTAPFIEPGRAGQFALIGVAFLAGVVAYFTPYWRPVLYLLGVVFAVFLAGVWAFAGFEHARVGIVTGVVATAFVMLALYLFVREEFRAAS
ncbi:uncharacterized protein NP_2748A [Natronomonas pharaonis DSM 2160]|uniref:Uncharacterized protein n=1 Tax=Natronomonas pharaonis (strain ATCC 35678 / DSM 2160 / CIP 103997 / JCM 8858 / NBRC 14720 / NCIMB 2260 / Gabara) TaxID=348780 RepID=A0A1U7EWJ9_NATPD|nr:hypothetical protein [Natronomonas pharaonis]CAI49465.1 uncharacterized protein NP_2748A [Natronomonas pharaonis DSM 2160]